MTGSLGPVLAAAAAAAGHERRSCFVSPSAAAPDAASSSARGERVVAAEVVPHYSAPFPRSQAQRVGIPFAAQQTVLHATCNAGQWERQ